MEPILMSNLKLSCMCHSTFQKSNLNYRYLKCGFLITFIAFEDWLFSSISIFPFSVLSVYPVDFEKSSNIVSFQWNLLSFLGYI